MYTKTLLIPNYESAKSFVDIAGKYPDVKISLTADDMTVDAHSILGVMSIDKSAPVTLSVEGDCCEDFISDIEKFAATI